MSVRTLTLLAQYARPQKQHIKNILFSGSYQRVLFVIMSMTLIRANTAKNVAGPFVCQFLILHFSSFVHDTYLQVCCVTILPF